MSVIANTTVISNFAGIDQLDLLRRLYPTLYISTEVYSEIQQGLNEGYTFYAAVGLAVYPVVADGWIHLASVTGDDELRLYSTLPVQLHPGEAACIAIAHGRGWQFLSDDLAARRAARALQVGVSGTVGCLVRAVEQGLGTLEEANAWLQAMVRQGFRSPVLDLSQIVQAS